MFLKTSSHFDFEVSIVYLNSSSCPLSNLISNTSFDPVFPLSVCKKNNNNKKMPLI